MVLASAVVAVGTAATPTRGTVPLRTRAAVGAGWQLQVLGSTSRAITYSGGYRDTLPSGVSVVLVNVAVRYTGRGVGNAAKLALRVYVSATPDYVYAADQGAAGCAPTPAPATSTSAMHDTLSYQDHRVPSNHSLEGRLCFEVAPSMVPRLRLYVDPPGCSTLVILACDRVWFALY
jgi:hypothetical protein